MPTAYADKKVLRAVLRGLQMSTDVYSRIEQEAQQMRKITQEKEALKPRRKHRHPVLFVISSILLVLIACSFLGVLLAIFLLPLLLLLPVILKACFILLFPILLVAVWLVSR